MMIENVLVRKNLSFKVKITVKSLICVLMIALATALPQLVHLVAGRSGGAVWNPIFPAILLGSCLLGWQWGLGLGLTAPIISYLLTLPFGNPMPALARVPFMMAELVAAAGVAGLFTKKIAQNGWMAFPAVLLGHTAGRLVYFFRMLIFQEVSPISFGGLWANVVVGFPGVLVQSLLVPLIVMGLKYLLYSDKRHERKKEMNNEQYCK